LGPLTILGGGGLGSSSSESRVTTSGELVDLLDFSTKPRNDGLLCLRLLEVSGFPAKAVPTLPATFGFKDGTAVLVEGLDSLRTSPGISPEIGSINRAGLGLLMGVTGVLGIGVLITGLGPLLDASAAISPVAGSIRGISGVTDWLLEGPAAGFLSCFSGASGLGFGLAKSGILTTLGTTSGALSSSELAPSS